MAIMSNELSATQSGNYIVSSEQSIDNLVLLDSQREANLTSKRLSDLSVSADKWPGLLERVIGAARYIRDVHDRAQEQEFRVQEILEQVRSDMTAARAQVQAAEQQIRDVQARSSRLIKAAEERTRVAEERAATAEQMLLRISETIDAEFVVEPADEPTKMQASGAHAYLARAAS